MSAQLLLTNAEECFFISISAKIKTLLGYFRPTSLRYSEPLVSDGHKSLDAFPPPASVGKQIIETRQFKQQ